MPFRYGDFAFCGEDQRAYQRWWLDNPATVAVDDASSVFQCLHGRSWDVEIELIPGAASANLVASPVLFEVLEVLGADDGTGGGAAVDGDGAARHEVAAVVTRGPARRPLVLHFNSHDGKGMMRDLMAALRAAETQANAN